MRQKTFKHIEQELFLYQETKRDIARIREELVHAHRQTDTNIGGGKGNLPGDPTGNVATRLASDTELTAMQGIVDAVDWLYENANVTEQRFMKLYYFTRPQTLTLEGVSMQMYISTRHLWRIRRDLAHRMAHRLGWW